MEFAPKELNSKHYMRNKNTKGDSGSEAGMTYKARVVTMNLFIDMTEPFRHGLCPMTYKARVAPHTQFFKKPRQNIPIYAKEQKRKEDGTDFKLKTENEKEDKEKCTGMTRRLRVATKIFLA